ncbi:cytochrome c oxidase accessory protein CcoG [Leptospira perolatii]|uniref:Cytochrome c oxidase accessory protein CcoG n=1 Tax=Leptospira perolatii TaxID=2023191 RepID=A0A2M9ZQH1_9LEPT|nr:cytochrome c oxidase accessory protein CcoG [Leptospira perolatii]PJZ70458.1 cytochrome c oxidase accessory protein CcoG [Leptospira perolatii]PJZ74294.1 cytochrome c oxidase accessory protein CcoG [Leptospira perolatii]
MIVSRPISGKIRSARNIVQIFLILLFFGTPWLRWGSLPLIQLDIPERKFFLLGSIFTPQEGYFLHLLLLGLGLSLFFFTTLIGRVWCGWACPQTIYTDIFDGIGRIVLGKKYGKKDASVFGIGLVHLAWIFVSMLASFAWISYFADPYLMISGIRRLVQIGEDSNWMYFLGFFTFAMYVDIAFIREQFCKYACPYARFQTVMMDSQSVNITYNYRRGEPRRKGTVKIGDCTACNMCLVVCPTGIDIREGTNVGCIACGKCSDACTHQMAKEGKKTLIGYWSENQILENNTKIKWIRPRTVAYGGLLLLVISALSILLWNRVPMYLSILPDRNIQPMILPDKTVRNFYEVQIQNYTFESRTLKVEVEKTDLKGELRIVVGGTEQGTINLPENSNEHYRLIIELHAGELDLAKRSHEIRVLVRDIKDPNFVKTNTVPFLLPIHLVEAYRTKSGEYANAF